MWSLSNNNNAAKISNTNSYENGDTIWSVSYQNKQIGTLRIHANISTDALVTQGNTAVEETWLGGSTNSAK